MGISWTGAKLIENAFELFCDEGDKCVVHNMISRVRPYPINS